MLVLVEGRDHEHSCLYISVGMHSHFFWIITYEQNCFPLEEVDVWLWCVSLFTSVYVHTHV